MQRRWLAVVLFAASSATLAPISSGHGGTYAGPGDTVPPGGGGSGGGSGPPGTGNPNGPSTPTPGTGVPRGPGTPPSGPRGPNDPGAPNTQGGFDAGTDLTRWQFWWELNKDRFLGLRAKLYANDVLTESEVLWLGHGQKRQTVDLLRPSRDLVEARVVPALLGALGRERANDAVTGALIALARIGGPRGEDGRSRLAGAIAPYLLDSSQEIAETAALALGILGDEGAADLLAAVVANDRSALAAQSVPHASDVSERTRAFAAFGLGLLASQVSEPARARIADALAQPLSDGGRSFGRRDVPAACALAFGLVELAPLAGDEARPAEASGSGAFACREDQLAWLLERFEDARASAWIRAQMPRSLARLADDLPADHPLRARVVGALGAALDRAREDSPVVEESCVLALGALGRGGDRAAIRRTLLEVSRESKDAQARRFALLALGEVARDAQPPEAPRADVASRHESAVSHLLERLARAQAGERCFAALALGIHARELAEARQSPPADVLRALRAALEEAVSADEVGAYAIALGIARDLDAGEILREKLEQVGAADARGYVALALGMIGDRAAIVPIADVVSRSKYDPDLLRSAATALGLLGDKTAVADLIAMLGAARSLASQAAIASALGAIGDARSIEPLIALLEDQERTALARGFAAAALGIVGDEDELPWRSQYSVDLNYRANTEALHSPEAGTGLLEIL